MLMLMDYRFEADILLDRWPALFVLCFCYHFSEVGFLCQMIRLPIEDNINRKHFNVLLNALQNCLLCLTLNNSTLSPCFTLLEAEPF